MFLFDFLEEVSKTFFQFICVWPWNQTNWKYTVIGDFVVVIFQQWKFQQHHETSISKFIQKYFVMPEFNSIIICQKISSKSFFNYYFWLKMWPHSFFSVLKIFEIFWKLYVLYVFIFENFQKTTKRGIFKNYCNEFFRSFYDSFLTAHFATQRSSFKIDETVCCMFFWFNLNNKLITHHLKHSISAVYKLKKIK